MMMRILWLLSPLLLLCNACTMLIINPMPCRLTEGYSLGSEEIQQEAAPSILELASADELGEQLLITGVVYAADCTTPNVGHYTATNDDSQWAGFARSI